MKNTRSIENGGDVRLQKVSRVPVSVSYHSSIHTFPAAFSFFARISNALIVSAAIRFSLASSSRSLSFASHALAFSRNRSISPNVASTWDRAIAADDPLRECASSVTSSRCPFALMYVSSQGSKFVGRESNVQRLVHLFEFLQCLFEIILYCAFGEGSCGIIFVIEPQKLIENLPVDNNTFILRDQMVSLAQR
jgi:hypothetical protein